MSALSNVGDRSTLNPAMFYIVFLLPCHPCPYGSQTRDDNIVKIYAAAPNKPRCYIIQISYTQIVDVACYKKLLKFKCDFRKRNPTYISSSTDSNFPCDTAKAAKDDDRNAVEDEDMKNGPVIDEKGKAITAIYFEQSARLRSS
ncbi:hypothetical protein CEXT_646381 [Caerostris extrusa]|uniref:Uncharacterized protein n=1 Tax=Caerostris extrusa TaxID=172846 RepID=A0AAV4MBL5_CAEEX|nr:hypothetical protein CEXT_646381 [Caerostris extrusa]